MSLRGLHRTYAAVRPELGPVGLAWLTARGALSYGAYWAGLAVLPWLSPSTVERLVRAEGVEHVLAGMADGRGQVLLLLHQGHWELAGLWAAHRLGPVTTVAESLTEGPMARLTRTARRRAGLHVVEAGSGVAGARRLVEVLRAGGVVALLADRDLTDTGLRPRRVPVNLGGARTTLAAGPAELALATGADLRPVACTTSWLGARHRVIFGAAVDAGRGSRAERVASMTQACADLLGEPVRRHTTDWHLTSLPRGSA